MDMRIRQYAEGRGLRVDFASEVASVQRFCDDFFRPVQGHAESGVDFLARVRSEIGEDLVDSVEKVFLGPSRRTG